jgi:hypothetical protein
MRSSSVRCKTGVSSTRQVRVSGVCSTSHIAGMCRYSSFESRDCMERHAATGASLMGCCTPNRFCHVRAWWVLCIQLVLKIVLSFIRVMSSELLAVGGRPFRPCRSRSFLSLQTRWWWEVCEVRHEELVVNTKDAYEGQALHLQTLHAVDGAVNTVIAKCHLGHANAVLLGDGPR